MGCEWLRAAELLIFLENRSGDDQYFDGHLAYGFLIGFMGFRLNLKWGGLSSLSTTSSSLTSSFSCRCKDSSNLVRLSNASLVCREADTSGDSTRVQVCSSSLPVFENCYARIGEMKMAPRKGSDSGLFSSPNDNVQVSIKEDELVYLTSLQPNKESEFKLLMKNIDMLEDMFTDNAVIRLERDILKQLERLGALRYFHSCLSAVLQSSTQSALSSASTEIVEETKVFDSVDKQLPPAVFHSGKKEWRKLRRKGVLEKRNDCTEEKSPSKTITRNPWSPVLRRLSRTRNKRQKLSKNEAELSTGVKMVAELEKIRLILEEETGEVTSLSRWAEAARLEKKELLQRLNYGWCCMDELVRSTRSLVLFIARNYWGLGVAMEDLIQVGNIGVLQGAERFDKSKGYRFSTYVQYWIRKSMSTLISKHSRGIKIPFTLSKRINQVQKARKTLTITHGKRPDDSEISKLTGLSAAKIASVNGCLRVVGSVTQKIRDDTCIKFLEVATDESIMSAEEAVMRQDMVKSLNTLLNGLEPREIQVLKLRFGIGNHQRQSLEEIGRQFCVSKECVRKIERAALEKLRNDESLQIFSHYVQAQ